MSYQGIQDPCCAGGVTNFAKIGLQTSHPNYGSYHVTGLVMFGNLEIIARNCVFCGRDCSEFFLHLNP